jgi:hypothetical protein
MLRQGLLAAFFAAMLSVNVFAADVVARVAPPRAVVQTPMVVTPGPGYVSTPNYQPWGGPLVTNAVWVRTWHPRSRVVYVRRRGRWGRRGRWVRTHYW